LGESLGGVRVVGVHVRVGASGEGVELPGEKMSQLTALEQGRETERLLFEFCRRAVWLELENFIMVYCVIIEKEARGREE
jgi:hypothetical protein